MPRLDLNKVLTERERHGSSKKHRAVRHLRQPKQILGAQTWPFAGESVSPHPYKEGIKKPYGYDTKSFSENLNPLYGYLRKSVGKSWDVVYGQLCRVFDKRSVINQHILIHLNQIVQIHTFISNGKVSYVDNSYSHDKGVKPIAGSSFEYYVHPISKVLFANTKKVSYKQVYKIEAQVRADDKTKHLKLLSEFSNQNGTGARYAIKIKDLWYEISIIKKPEPVRRRRTNSQGEVEYYTHFPEVNSVSIHGAKYEPLELARADFYVSRKHQMNTAQIRRHKLPQ